VAERETVELSEPAGLPRLPPGRHGLPRDFVVKNQRDRLAAATIAVVAEQGYRDVTISGICAAAGLSRRTFYSYFSSKEECCLQTFDAILDHLVAVMEEAGAQHDWPIRVEARIGAMLEVFGANPDLALFVAVVPLRAGEEISAHQSAGMERLLGALTADKEVEVESLRPVSRTIEQALMGGIMTLVAQQVEVGNGERLPDLLPDLVELFLTPFLGRKRANRSRADRR
jgi:AcrR family transcriptional regulator